MSAWPIDRPLLIRWSPAIFWCAAAGIALALLHGFRPLALGLLLIALPSLAGLYVIRRDRHRTLALEGIGEIAATDFATSGAAGFAPVGSGTFGAVAALPLGYYLAELDWPVRWAALILGTALSLYATKHYLIVKRRYLEAKAAGENGARPSPASIGHSKDLDPSEVVVDESIGVLLALAFVPWELGWVIAAFLLFRAFDITKPGPVGWAERKLAGAAGVVFDDVVAGLMAGALLALVRAFIAGR